LTDIARESIVDAVDVVVQGNYRIERRMVMEANENLFVNEIVVKNDDRDRVCRVDVLIDDDYLATYVGDGVIVSTPTGSTAYNMSCGGPILQPTDEMLAITAIAPFHISARSLVIDGSHTIEIRPAPNMDTYQVIDGQETTTLENRYLIKKHSKQLQLIKTNCLSFSYRLRQKLGWAEGTTQ
jgi:NAD+ kinase